MKISKRTNRICLGLAIAALVLIFVYQVVYASTDKHGSSEYILPPFRGWNKTSGWIRETPALMKHNINDQRIEYNILNGSTWNIVNTTDGTTSKVSFDIAPPGCSYNGHIKDCSWVITWFTASKISLDHGNIRSEMKFQKVSQNHIELTDQHGGIIHQYMA